MRLARPISLARITLGVALPLGAMLALAFPEPDVVPLAFVSLAGLVAVLDRVGAKKGFATGLLFGIGFFGVLIYWISIIGYLAYVFLVLLQALFFGAFGAAWGAASRFSRNIVFRIFTPAALWIAFEYIRSTFPLRGFTWGQLAQGFHDVGYMLRITGLGGSWLLAGLVVAISATAIVVVDTLRAGERKLAIGAVALCLGLVASPVSIPEIELPGEPVRVAIVQGNVPRDVAPSFAKEMTIIRSHSRLTAGLPDGLDLVVWPESAVGIDLEREPLVENEVATAARSVGAPMIVGGNLDLPDDRYRVVAFHVTEEGEFVDRYQKTHLVPFGEFVPARRFLDWIPALDQVPRDAVPADEEVVFDLPFGPVAPVISFEGDFGSLVRGRIAAGGRLLIVATNTSTWEESWASAQHVAMSQVRAAENGVFVIHAALSGVSALIEPDGSVTERTPLWTATTLVGDVQLPEGVTPYARVGDVVAYLSLIWSLFLIPWGMRRRTRMTPSSRHRRSLDAHPPQT